MTLSPHRHHVRHNTKTAKIRQCILSRLGLVLVRRLQKRHVHHVHEQAIFPPHIQRKTANRLNKTQAFVVADRTADFHNMHVAFGRLANSRLDRISQMRHHLYRLAAKLAGPLIGDQIAQQPA